MKFYEFNDHPYYALIGANSDYEAIGLYRAEVADLSEDEAILPDELTEDEARAKVYAAPKEDDGDLTYFEEQTQGTEPFIALIDRSLV